MRKSEKFEWIEISNQEYNKLKKIENKIESTKVYKRIQAFKLMYKKWKYSAIAEFLNVTNDTITDWINLYKKDGLNGLVITQYKGGQPKLNQQQLAELKEKAAQGNFTFAKDVQHYIETKFGIKYNLKHVQLLSKKNFVYPLKKQEKFQGIHPV